MTNEQAQQLVTVLVTAFPNTMVRLSPEQQSQTMTTYRRMISDLDYVAANAAVARLLATQKWIPTAAEIREATLALTVGEKSVGGEQWGSVLNAIRAQGVYRKPGVDFGFVDETTARCVSALGWEELCKSENTIADRARFIDTYDQLATQHRTKQLTETLPAIRALEAQKAKLLEKRTGDASVASVLSGVLSLAGGDL